MAEEIEGNLDQGPTPEEVLWRLREYPLGEAVVSSFISYTDPRSYSVRVGGRNEFCLFAAPKDARVPLTLVLCEHAPFLSGKLLSGKPGLELLIFQSYVGGVSPERLYAEWDERRNHFDSGEVVRVSVGPSPTGEWGAGSGLRYRFAAHAKFSLRELDLLLSPPEWIFEFLAKLTDRLKQEGREMAHKRWWQSDEGGHIAEELPG